MYQRKRGDGTIRIAAKKEVRTFLELIQPYIIVKRAQVDLALEMLDIPSSERKELSIKLRRLKHDG